MKTSTSQTAAAAPKHLLLALTALATLTLPSTGQSQVVANVDFETSTDVANHFRAMSANNAAFGQTSNGAANDYMTVTSSGASGLRSFIYDTTPASSAVQNTFSGTATIEGDIDTTGSSTSFGVYILNPSAESTANQFLALFNWDNSGTSDLLRFFKTSSVSTGSASGQQYTSGNVNAGVNVTDSFAHYSLTYKADTTDSTQAVLNLTVGSFSTGDVLMGTGTYFSTYEVGLRFSPNTSGQSVYLDNFTITQVPEPSTLGMILGGGALLAWLRLASTRQRRR